MWQYEQRSGKMFLNGHYVGTGYAGMGPHKNIPEDDDIPMLGPLPAGKYIIGPAYIHPKLGPITMNLLPALGNDMHGRAFFRVHGDNATGTASEGCIVQNRSVRNQISESDDRDLTVVADYIPEKV